MFAAREKGRDAKVINRSLFIDNQASDINYVLNEHRPVCWVVRVIHVFFSSAVWHKENVVNPSILSGSFPDSNSHKENVCVYMFYVLLFVYLFIFSLTQFNI